MSKINGTLEVHKICRSILVDGVCKMEFFYTAVDEKPFHVQYYKKDGDLDVCGHAELPLSLTLIKPVLNGTEFMS